MFCGKCGQMLPEGARVCPKCGKMVQSSGNMQSQNSFEFQEEQPKKSGVSCLVIGLAVGGALLVLFLIVLGIVFGIFGGVVAGNGGLGSMFGSKSQAVQEVPVEEEQEEEEEEEEAQEPVGGSNQGSEVGNGDYILPQSSSTYITESDLHGLSAYDCRIARNEIYARHGRMFKDAALQEYFNSKSWYTPTIPADSFQESMLNEYEKANKDVILQYERAQGYQ